jgi:hypothetical protein
MSTRRLAMPLSLLLNVALLFGIIYTNTRFLPNYIKNNEPASTMIYSVNEEEELATTRRTATTTHKRTTNETTTPMGYVRHDKIIGHLHYAKTAGTTVNGELAAHYERVCGHKGYSYDWDRPNTTRQGPDVVTLKHGEGFDRGRVHPAVMDEIGYNDCDYISLEQSWKKWKAIAAIVGPLELHVPCRDPLEHLMSQCNMRKRIFNCDGNNLKDQVNRCLVWPDRFDRHLTRIRNVTMKCFSAVPVQPYVEYMDQILQRKRIEVDYVFRATNRDRKKNNECIWTNSEVANRTLAILLQSYDYYRWCDQCLGSENDLLL